MSDRPQVKITISGIGKTSIDAQGYVGNACDVATKPFEDAIAGSDGIRVNKQEYQQTEIDVEQEVTQNW